MGSCLCRNVAILLVECEWLLQEIVEELRKCGEFADSLDDKDLEYLEAACMLHNIGLSAGKKGYHKQSYRLIVVNASFLFRVSDFQCHSLGTLVVVIDEP